MYKVLASFCGKINGQKDQIINISDSAVVKDLKQAGYIEEYKEKSDKELKASVKALEEENAKQKEELDKLMEEKKKLEDEVTSLKNAKENIEDKSQDSSNTDESQKPKVSK